MVRTPASVRRGVAGTADDGSSSGNDSSGGVLRKVLLGAGLAVGAYVVARKLRSGGGSADESGDWYQLSIEESVDEANDDAAAEADDQATTAGDGESDLADEELPGEERTDEEIEGRAEPNVDEEPAEPGEMNVDEEVVDQVVDEENEADEE